MRTAAPWLLTIGIFALGASSAAAQQYVVTDLGTLGGDRSQAAAINALGQVAGWSTIAGSTDVHPFVWSNGTMQDLGVLPGYTSCFARAINDSTMVVGHCQNGSLTTHGFVWTPAGGLQPLNAPDDAAALGVNNHGDVVGAYGQGAFVLHDGVFTILDPSATARDIDDNGHIVGESEAMSHAVMWDASGEHDLGTLDGANTSMAFAVRSDGLAVGNAGFFGSTVATYFSQYGVGNLGTLGGNAAQANAIAGDMVVGWARDASETNLAFLYQFSTSTMIDLNGTIPQGSGWTLQSANGVNDAGLIAGDGVIAGATHAFLLQPPSSSGGGTGGNLLLKPGFEEYTPPLLGAPGWVSDTYRQVAAKSETNQPHSGNQNAACWATDNLDCGMYQDLPAPGSGTYTLTFYANADRPGALVGANVANTYATSAEIAVRGFGNYGAAYTLTFTANKGDTIRVWMYSPATPGYLVLDDVSLTGPQ